MPRTPASRCSDAAHLSDADLVLAWGLVLEGFTRTTRRLHAELDAAVGLPPAWVEVVFRLRRTPGHALPTTHLAHDVSFSSGGFTKLLDRLVAAGLVERQPCPTDRRVTYAALTRRGVELADEALAVHAASLRRHVLAVIGQSGVRTLGETMRRLRDAATRTDAQEEEEPARAP